MIATELAGITATVTENCSLRQPPLTTNCELIVSGSAHGGLTLQRAGKGIGSEKMLKQHSSACHVMDPLTAAAAQPDNVQNLLERESGCL